ncbi:MAG TPA: outer membrane protein transport protein, partial [Dyella sp.]|uniref:OmpP1/FadL family transporter n=1 Tax=Dyella sp. TaxID=1869338 RepID=UPI002B65C642
MHTSFRNTAHGGRPLALAALGLAVAGALAAPQAHASSFQLKEDSAQAMGRAYAGSATAGGDVSVVANAPAAMSDLKGTYFEADVTAINFSANFTGSAHDVLGNPISGGNGGDAGTTMPVPSFFFATQVSDRWHVGAAFTVPFGFKTEYDNNWVGRYNSIYSKFESIDGTMSASFNVTDNFAIGASAIAQHTTATLSNAINFSSVALGLAGPGTPANLPISEVYG